MTDDAQPAPRETRLVVLRHGEWDYSNGEIVLTAESEELAAAAAETIRGLGTGPVVMFTSEVERAILTGAAIGRVLGVDPTAVPWLYCDEPNLGARQAIQNALRALGHDGTLVLIGHGPQVEKLTGVRDPLHLTPHVQTVRV